MRTISIWNLPDLSGSSLAPLEAFIAVTTVVTKVFFFTGSPSASISTWNYVPPLCLWHVAAGGCPGLPAEEVTRVRGSHSQGTHHECGMSTSPWLEAGLKLQELTPAPWSSRSTSFTRAVDLHIFPQRFDEPSKKFPPQEFRWMQCLYYRGLSTCATVLP